MGMLDHVGIGVADYARSKAVLRTGARAARLLAPAGVRRCGRRFRQGRRRPAVVLPRGARGARRADGSTSRSARRAASSSTRSMRRRSRRAAPTTARPESAGTTTTTTAATSSIPTATTSRPSATSRPRGAEQDVADRPRRRRVGRLADHRRRPLEAGERLAQRLGAQRPLAVGEVLRLVAVRVLDVAEVDVERRAGLEHGVGAGERRRRTRRPRGRRRRSSRACGRSRAPAGRSRPAAAIASTSSIVPKSRTRPITSTPNGTSRSFASSRSRRSPSWSTTSAIARSRSRPSRKPGWKTISRAPQAFARPAVWSSIPSAILNFLPRSTWPMNAASGACTESATSAASAAAAEQRSRVVVEPEAADEADLAGPVALGRERRERLLERRRLGQPARADSGSRPCRGAYAVRPCFYVFRHAQAPFPNRPARARHRPPPRRSLARDARRDRVEPRGRRRLPARRVRQGLLRRAHRGRAGLALPRARLPHPGPQAGEDAEA